jgi:hypothetical protein
MPPSLECKDEGSVFPHAIVSNINSDRGRSARGNAVRAMLGRRGTEAGACPPFEPHRCEGEPQVASQDAEKAQTEESESSHNSSDSAAFEPSETT